MSHRARRVSADAVVTPFDWSRGPQAPAEIEPLLPDAQAPRGAAGRPQAAQPAPQPAQAPPPAPPAPLDATQQARLAALEREAFAKGYEQGERAGAEAGAKRAEAMLRRLAQTLDELADVRRSMIRQTERQMVQLALAIAKRVVRREVALDGDLTLTMARVALDRLGDSTSVTIRLNPDDFEATVRRHDQLQASQHVRVVADPAVTRGGCLVESDFGYVDATVDAQFQELARALLVEEGQEVPSGNNGH
jgi:flagellar assembly protein FliH